EDVLVMGAGTMGLLLMQLLNRAGARSVAVVDRKESRLEVATAVGAAAVATDVGSLSQDVFGVAVDATGAPAAIEAAFGRLGRGSRLMIFGVTSGDAEVSFSPFRIYNDEITIIGSMAVLNSYGAAVSLMVDGTVATGPLLAEPYPLDRFGDALASVRAGEGIKIQVAPGT
ncbi:MAG TPA: zinc-binding dehydrogenase, partial [Streptosporangiaceae bacterium]